MTARRLRIVVIVGALSIAVGLLIAFLTGLPAQAPTDPTRYTDTWDEGPSRVLGWLLLVGGLLLTSGLLGYLLGTHRRPIH